MVDKERRRRQGHDATGSAEGGSSVGGWEAGAKARLVQLTMSVFLGILNDDDEQQAGDDPSAAHHVDRGGAAMMEARQTSQGEGK